MAHAYGTPGVVGHVRVIKVTPPAGTNYVVINDPWSPCVGERSGLPYNEYMNPAGMSTDWNTWYNIAKK